MPSEKLVERIGRTVIVSGEVTIIHSVRLCGRPLRRTLVVDYLQAKDRDMSVRISCGKRVSPQWDLAAIVNGDFKSDKLSGFCEFARSVVNTSEAKKPVIALRHLVTEHSACMLKQEPCATREECFVIHSLKGPHKHAIGA